jgi:hypothetical protein
MKAAQSHQKSYADKRRRRLEFVVGDYVYLKVTPMKKVHRFRIRIKLAPRYVGPYHVIERKGPVAYKIQSAEELSSIFPVFHVSQLRKCLRVLEERIEPRSVKIKADLEYKGRPVGIMDTKERVTRNNVVKTYKVVWSHHDDRDATWEIEDYLKKVYPKFHKGWLVTQNLRRDFFKEGTAIHSSVKLALGLHKSCMSISISISISAHVHCICAMILCANKIWI